MRMILAAAVAASFSSSLLAEDLPEQRARGLVLAQAPQGATIPAQQTPVISGVPAGAPTQAAGVIERQMEGELLGTDLIGQPLHAAAGGAKIGDVADVLISADRKLRGVIVAVEGQGAQKKRVGIPFEAIQRSQGDQRQVRLIANVDPAALRAAKDFEGLAKEASLDDNQDLTKPGAATGGSVPATR